MHQSRVGDLVPHGVEEKNLLSRKYLSPEPASIELNCLVLGEPDIVAVPDLFDGILRHFSTHLGKPKQHRNTILSA